MNEPIYPPSGTPYAKLYPKKKNIIEAIANFPMFFAAIVDTLEEKWVEKGENA